MQDLHRRVVVITGAGSGIGRATAQAFAARGARLHLVDLDGSRVERVAQELGTERAHPHQVDCADGAAMAALAAAVYRAEGRVDVLHNNAGVCVGGPVEQLELDDWRWIIDVNLWGVIHGITAFLPRMIEQQSGGHIVNTASMAGLVGLPMVAPYCATKFAVVGLSEALAVELGAHGIQVSAVCPGAVRTEVMRAARLRLPGRWDEWIRAAFDRTAASPERLAEQIVEAVVRDRCLVLQPGHLWPLWLTKRMSYGLYQRSARWLTTRALRLGQALPRARN